MKTAKIISVLLLGILLTNPVLATTLQSCVKVNKKEIEALFDRWNNSLKTDDAKKVDVNYMDNAVLLPTISNKPRVSREQRIDYFEKFLKKHPIGKIDSRTIKLGCNKAIDTGLYTFTTDDGKKIHARYTFTYRWNSHEWLISSHHSSAMPETN